MPDPRGTYNEFLLIDRYFFISWMNPITSLCASAIFPGQNDLTIDLGSTDRYP